MKAPEDKPFYVGYLPIPPALKGLMQGLALSLVILATALGVSLAAVQEDPGSGQWALGTSTFEGVVTFDPYPMLLRAGDDGTTETLLVVGLGKFGVADRLRPYEDQWVQLTGFEITGRGTTMVELNDGDAAIVPMRFVEAPEPLPVRPVTDLGPVDLAGEIIDSKCWLGVMRPGGGKVHKACATLCILGDIPPMFAVTRPDGSQDAFLVVAPDGAAIKDPILDYVADPVAVTGQLEGRGRMTVLRLDPSSLRRLGT